MMPVGNWKAEHSTATETRITLSAGNVLQEFTDFKYLGFWLLTSSKDHVRKVLAWSAITRLNRITKSKDLHHKTKLNLFTALIESILLSSILTVIIDKATRR